MIEKSGKLIIDDVLHKNRYDKNENYGVDLTDQCVKFYEIMKEVYLDKPRTILEKLRLAFEMLKLLDDAGNKITLSKFTVLRHQRDFMRLAFDPPSSEDKNGK